MQPIFVGSDDGVYRLTDGGDAGAFDSDHVLEAGRVFRVRTFDALAGVLAATTTGLFHSAHGRTWTDLGVPTEQVHAVGASPTGERLYAGTRPAAIYVADVGDGPLPSAMGAWRELEAFQDLPSRADWRLPRHEHIAQVKDVHALGEGRVVTGVEVGGVHLSPDGGRTWEERRAGVNDDIHELHASSADTWFAATGQGLFRTGDVGQTWSRLDGDVDQRYFRAVHTHEGVTYASENMANSSTWEDDDADPALFARDGETLREESLPTPGEMVTGLTSIGDDVVAGTHRGTLLVGGPRGWEAVTEFPVPGQLTGRYTPLAAIE